ncbi:hypothetical protein ACLKA6_017395, partial [Drosophila palustris]
AHDQHVHGGRPSPTKCAKLSNNMQQLAKGQRGNGQRDMGATRQQGNRVQHQQKYLQMQQIVRRFVYRQSSTWNGKKQKQNDSQEQGTGGGWGGGGLHDG